MLDEVGGVQLLCVEVYGTVASGCQSPLIGESPDGVELDVVGFVICVRVWCRVLLECAVHAWMLCVVVVVVAVVGLVLIGSVVPLLRRPFVVRSRVVLRCMRAEFRKAQVDAVVLEVFS